MMLCKFLTRPQVPEGGGGMFVNRRRGVDEGRKRGVVNSGRPRQPPMMALMVVSSTLEMQVAR